MDLKNIAKTFFDNDKELKQIFGTKDGHFFYDSSLAKNHCFRNGIEGDDKYTLFTPEDFKIVKEVVKVAYKVIKGNTQKNKEVR